MENTKVTKDLEQKTLTFERVFDAPKEKLWKAYADKTWFERWWGPEGWQTTVKEFNFTPGGRIHYGMKCVDESQTAWFGQESWGIMTIESINEPDGFSAIDKFANAKGEVNDNMPTQRFEVELVDEANKTRLVSRSLLTSAEQLEELVKMGMVEGFSSQLNRLESLLVE